MINCKLSNTIITILTAVGAINWGLVALFKFDLVMFLFGSMPLIANILYIVVAISGILLLFNLKCIFSKNNCNNSDQNQ